MTTFDLDAHSYAGNRTNITRMSTDARQENREENRFVISMPEDYYADVYGTPIETTKTNESSDAPYCTRVASNLSYNNGIQR